MGFGKVFLAQTGEPNSVNIGIGVKRSQQCFQIRRSRGLARAPHFQGHDYDCHLQLAHPIQGTR